MAKKNHNRRPVLRSRQVSLLMIIGAWHTIANRWRTLLFLLLAHLVGSYFGAGLLVVLAKAIDHWVPHSFWVLLFAAPVMVPGYVFGFILGEGLKLLAVVVVVVGYATGFYVFWKLTYSFRVPQSRLERGRGFEVALTQSRVPDNVVESEGGER